MIEPRRAVEALVALAADPEAVWSFVTSPAGIAHEFGPVPVDADAAPVA
ncbi:MAG: hypothetical protein ACK5OX_16275 [Desertimonas sp.]